MRAPRERAAPFADPARHGPPPAPAATKPPSATVSITPPLAPHAAADRPAPRWRPWARSLRWRLFAATLAAGLVALLLAGLGLSGLFRDHVMRQFDTTLVSYLDEVTARLEFDAAGQPHVEASHLVDPRWSRPYSGLYWQVDAATGVGATGDAAPSGGTPGGGATSGGAASLPHGVLRSRSLWDTTLALPEDGLADGIVHRHLVSGPDGARLLLVERTVRRDPAGASNWRLAVGADLHETESAIARFNGVMAASLAVLLVLLGLAALAQGHVGLAPLRELQQALAALRQGRTQRLEGEFPAEVQGLIDDLHAVLDRNAEVVARARTQAGNLAHAIKTPLAVMAQAAQSAAAAQGAPARVRQGELGGTAGAAGATAAPDWAAVVQEQIEVARRQVDWHLARSRAAAAQGLPGARVALAPVLDGLLRVMRRVHAARGVAFELAPIDPALAFAGEQQDLQEMLGNLLDNAGKWARGRVLVQAAAPAAGRLHIVVDDDGPGIEPDRRAAVMARGARLDESVPGSGLGLAIVQELSGLYGGGVRLGEAPGGGLRVALELPGVTTARAGVTTA